MLYLCTLSLWLMFTVCKVTSSHSFKLQNSHHSIQIVVDSDVYVFRFVCMSDIFLADQRYQVRVTAHCITAAEINLKEKITLHPAQMSFVYEGWWLKMATQWLNNGSKLIHYLHHLPFNQLINMFIRDTSAMLCRGPYSNN